jgi:ABC-type multidrug transport system, ATPase and permease components
MKHLKSIALKHKSFMCLYIAIGLAWTFLQSFSSRYFQKVIDNFTYGTLTITNIVIYGSALIAVYILSYLQNYPERKLEHGIELSLKTEALKKMSVIDYLSYVKIGTGTLIQRIENGAAAGSNILFGFYLRLISELLPQMLFSVVFIFIINRTVMIAILIGYIIVFIVTNLLLKALYKIKANILVNEENFNHFIVRGFMEMVVFRINRRFEHEIKKAETASNEIINSKVKMTLIHEAFFTIFVILVGVLKIGIIAYGWTTKSLTIGEIVALISLVDNAYMPVAIFNVCYVQYKLDMVAFKRYTDFLDAKEDIHLTQGITVSEISGGISLSEICFNYNERGIFNNLNLDISHGNTIAFVGESGSGKSTVVKLLVGLLHPDSGRIIVDGFDLNEINLNSYYENIAYLPQEPPIFDGSLRENLVFDDIVDDGVLIEAIRKAGLENLYNKLENGLNTPLGERGVSLSGGERQQLALARLWFSNANLVIFDEATSAMDNLTEEAVMKNVMDLLSGKTIIAIAHRLDSIKSFDNIIVFQDGHIVEQDKFDELIEKHQYFHELYNRAAT